MRILVVEDDRDLAGAVLSMLRKQGFVPDWAQSITEARGFLAGHPYSVVILDRGLPDGEGLQILAQKVGAPVLVVSARGEASSRIEGLDRGADDYLAKPFDLDELLARVRALRRRRPGDIAQPIVLAELKIDVAGLTVTCRDQDVPLPRRERLILGYLAQRAGRVVRREALMAAAYDADSEVQDNALEANISRLRKRLREADSGVVVDHVRGLGYILRAAA